MKEIRSPLLRRKITLVRRACRRAPWARVRVPIKIDKDSLKIKELEHVGIEKGEQLFRDAL
jgi:hypothetical protein